MSRASDQLLKLQNHHFFICIKHVLCAQECGPLESEAMVMGVLDQSFDVLVLRYGVQKRIYCKVSSNSAVYSIYFKVANITVYHIFRQYFVA